MAAQYEIRFDDKRRLIISVSSLENLPATYKKENARDEIVIHVTGANIKSKFPKKSVLFQIIDFLMPIGSRGIIKILYARDDSTTQPAIVVTAAKNIHFSRQADELLDAILAAEKEYSSGTQGVVYGIRIIDSTQLKDRLLDGLKLLQRKAVN